MIWYLDKYQRLTPDLKSKFSEFLKSVELSYAVDYSDNLQKLLQKLSDNN